MSPFNLSSWWMFVSVVLKDECKNYFSMSCVSWAIRFTGSVGSDVKMEKEMKINRVMQEEKSKRGLPPSDSSQPIAGRLAESRLYDNSDITCLTTVCLPCVCVWEMETEVMTHHSPHSRTKPPPQWVCVYEAKCVFVCTRVCACAVFVFTCITYSMCSVHYWWALVQYVPAAVLVNSVQLLVFVLLILLLQGKKTAFKLQSTVALRAQNKPSWDKHKLRNLKWENCKMLKHWKNV